MEHENKKIELTKPQAMLAEWAALPMQEYWSDNGFGGSEADEHKFYAPEDVIRVEGLFLYINSDLDVIDDFKYRIDEQFRDMIEDAIGELRTDGKPGRYTQSWANSQNKICDYLISKLEMITNKQER